MRTAKPRLVWPCAQGARPLFLRYARMLLLRTWLPPARPAAVPGAGRRSLGRLPHGFPSVGAAASASSSRVRLAPAPEVLPSDHALVSAWGPPSPRLDPGVV